MQADRFAAMSDRYTLYTMDNSPYSDKIRALLSYKKIPFVEHTENIEIRFGVLHARTGKTMVPVIITPDDQAMNDSTPMAAHLEGAHAKPATRWSDPAMDALAMLLEDYADEWLVRIMLTSRWYHDADASQNAAIIACGMTHGMYGVPFQKAAREFPPGIISNVPKMGATTENAESWYAMVPRILAAMDAALASSEFLTGSRAHLCDFAFYGMLNQIRRDPTGYGWMEKAPASVTAWLDRLESGCKEGGRDDGAPLADASSLVALTTEATQTYFRMSVANALAVEAESKEPVRAKLAAGFAFEAPPAKYNRKILSNNLTILESLYAGGGRLPKAVETVVLDELRPLRSGKSALLTETPALAAAL